MGKMSDEDDRFCFALDRFGDEGNIIVRVETVESVHTARQAQVFRKNRGGLLGTPLFAVPDLIHFDLGSSSPLCQVPTISAPRSVTDRSGSSCSNLAMPF